MDDVCLLIDSLFMNAFVQSATVTNNFERISVYKRQHLEKLPLSFGFSLMQVIKELMFKLHLLFL